MKPSQFNVVGVPHLSHWQLEDRLTALRVSYSVRERKKLRTVEMDGQPVAVHITDDPTDLTKGVNFVVASYAALSLTNYPVLDKPLRRVLLDPPVVVPVVKKPTVMDYVNSIAKPSVLTDINTAILRIQPYKLRKETQALVAAFFCGASERTTKRKLAASFKTEELIPLLEAAAPLRTAVSLLGTMSVEEAEAATGVCAFDIRYITAK